MAFILPFHPTLFPPPLHINKPHRASYRRFLPRKFSHYHFNSGSVHGPLDDIIDTIAGDISDSSTEHSESSFLDWANPLKASSTWTVTPLPVSRIPSGQPLTIRKNRSSRSTTSGSSMGGIRTSRKLSQGAPRHSDTVQPSGTPGTTEGAALGHTTTEDNRGHVSDYGSEASLDSEYQRAHTALFNALQIANLPHATQRRISDIFKDGFVSFIRNKRSRSDPNPKIASSSALEGNGEDSGSEDPTDEALRAYVMKKSSSARLRLGSILQQVSRQLPSPLARRQPDVDGQKLLPTTLKPVVRIHSEVKLLTEGGPDEFWVAVEIEGVLHNQKRLADPAIDIVFIVDNGYHVTKDCLNRALDAVTSSLFHLERGDRVALYMTHCTHQKVTGVVPDLLYPMRPYGAGTTDLFRELADDARKNGTQAWSPPRPNPPMAEVILAVARSLDDQNLKRHRSHIVLLTPTAHALHDVSKSYPDLNIHCIHPGVIPFYKNLDAEKAYCTEACCQNVSVSNWTQFQAVSNRIKNIIQHARSEEHVGDISGLSLELREKVGCEVLGYQGTTEIPRLRLGQVHTVLARIRVDRTEVKEVNLDSDNPILNSSLDANNQRQEVRNALVRGAAKAHVLSAQVLHQNSLHSSANWNYTESQLFVFLEMGGLTAPIDTSDEVHQRQHFHMLSLLSVDSAELYVGQQIAAAPQDHEKTKKLLQRMAIEIGDHKRILEYERTRRQSLPSCPGPIDLEATPHEWLVEKWDRKDDSRNRKATKARALV